MKTQSVNSERNTNPFWSAKNEGIYSSIVMLLYPWTLLSLSDEKSITSFRLPDAMGVNSNSAVARSSGPTVPTLTGEKQGDMPL